MLFLAHAISAREMSKLKEYVILLQVTKMTGEEDQTKFTKLFVGGIPYHSADETLKEYFEQFDDIVEAVIIRERTSQRSKGYGFVSCSLYFSISGKCQ